MAEEKTNQTTMITTSIVSSASEVSEDDSNGSDDTGYPIAKRRPRTSSRRNSVASAAHHEKHYVEHNYHDHLCDPIEPEVNTIEDPSEIAGNKKRRGHRGGVATPFPEKLHFMLSQMDQEDNTHIVSWQPHGRCFTVHQPKEFVEEIMPRYFKQTKLTSFQRQLNLYGFSRLTAGPDRGGYYHELFIRGRMDLCRRMVRTRVKGNGSKAASSPSTEPNFYSMPSCPERQARSSSSPPYPSPIDGSMDDIQAPSNDVDMIPSGNDDELILGADVTNSMQIVNDSICSTTMIVTTADDESSTCATPPPLSPTIEPVQTFNTCTPLSLPFSMPSLPIVSPGEPRTLVSPPKSPQLLASLSIPEEQELTFKKTPEDVHSGDQIFFEGLPFHYLETKDIEDSLLIGQ